jgi:hypothetical protein
MLINGGVYPNGYESSDGQGPQEPNNLGEVVHRLSWPQPDLSSTVSDHEFREYTNAISDASNETDVKASIIPLFLRATDSKTAKEDILFNNLTSPADSLKGLLKKAKPDYYYGSPPRQADPDVRETLSRYIVPSSSKASKKLPIAPNFFIEVRGPTAKPEIAQRQAWYDGVIGARAMHSLHSYNRSEPVYDNKIHTLSAVYDAKKGELHIYGHSIAQPNGKTEFYTFEVGSWTMATDRDSYVQGLTALKNAEEWTEDVREKAIEDANRRK